MRAGLLAAIDHSRLRANPVNGEEYSKREESGKGAKQEKTWVTSPFIGIGR